MDNGAKPPGESSERTCQGAPAQYSMDEGGEGMGENTTPLSDTTQVHLCANSRKVAPKAIDSGVEQDYDRGAFGYPAGEARLSAPADIPRPTTTPAEHPTVN